MNRREESAGTRAKDIGATPRYDARKIALALIPKLLLGICGYFAGLAELPFGARPFGLALLAATGKDTPFVYFGLVISAFVALELDEALVYFGVYTALLLMRLFTRFAFDMRSLRARERGVRGLLRGLFCERAGLRIISSALFGAALGAAVLFAGGLLYYDLFALLIIAVSAPFISFLLCGYFTQVDQRTRGELFLLWRDLGFLTLCAVAVFGAAKINLYGVSLSVLAAMLITFFVTYSRGVGYGAILGLVLGLCYSPMLAPIFVISALCGGVLMRFSAPLACFAAFFACCAWAFYVQGVSALLGVFGGILAACLIYSVLHKIIFVDLAAVKSKDGASDAKRREALECKVLPESVLDGIRLYEMNSRRSAMSDGLYRLSLFFDELKNNADAVGLNKDICVENYNKDFSGDASAPDYRALSSLLSKTMESETNEYEIDVELSKRLCLILSDLKLSIVGVLVYGVRKKTIYIRAKSKTALEENARAVIDAIAPVLPFLVDLQGFDIRRDGDSGGGALIVFEREKNSASVVRRRVIAQNETVCGDSTSAFKNKDNRFFAFISDGMGSGITASAVSQICTGFISNMLSVGSVNKELISMLNGFLCGRLRGSIAECSATLDLLELDLMNGRALIYKCGAAPSYVYRRGRLFKLRSESMPIGILRDVDVKCFELELCRGDIVVMVSDGVTGEGGECPWLFDLLAQNLPSRSLERTAELIVKYATAKGSVDDISVILVRVE